MKHSFANQFSKELKSIISGYPNFVYSRNNNLIIDGIPVFVFHTIDPILFEFQLQYLKDNGYSTLSINEFYETIVNSKSIKSKKLVLLTIDDARSSVWRFAYPLIKKYQMHATVFMIPGVTKDSKSCRKNLEDIWNANAKFEEIHDIDSNDSTLCSWQEIKEMYKSGFINIESHTLFHRESFKSLKIIDFIRPKGSFIPYNFLGSAYFSAADLGKKYFVSDYYGLPIFEALPLMLAGPKLNISPEFITKCKNVYHDALKNNNDWKGAIKNIVHDPANEKKYFSTEPHSKNDVLEDLKTAREIMQNKLDNNAGNHLCLPWAQGNNITVNICRELGIKSCFWGILENKKINKTGDDPYFISRIKNDFIFRLPGNGRKSFYSIYKYKLQRRLSGEKFF